MKKIIALLLMLCMLVGLTACSSDAMNTTLDYSRTTIDKWLNEGIAVKYNEFISSYTKDAEKLGCLKQLENITAAFSEMGFSNFGYIVENASETDVTNKYSYAATTYNQTYYLYFDAENRKIALEMNGDIDSSITLFEIRQLSSDEVTLHYYATGEDYRYTETKVYFKGKNGKVAYNYDLSVRPTRLYTAETVDSTYADEGDITFNLSNGSAIGYTTGQTTLGNGESVVNWYSGIVENLKEYKNKNSEAANQTGHGDEFNNYIDAIVSRDITEDILAAYSAGIMSENLYSADKDGKNIVMSYNGVNPNVQIRVNSDSENYAMELREIGKRKFAIQYYNRNTEGKYDVYRMVFRVDGDGRISYEGGLSSKPTLVYSNEDSALTFNWVETSGKYYFGITGTEVTYTDVVLAQQEALASEYSDDSEGA